MESPVKYSETVNTLSKIYDAIEDDITKLKSGKIGVGEARVILVGRKAQLRTGELALAMQRLYLQYEREKKDTVRKLRKVG